MPPSFMAVITFVKVASVFFVYFMYTIRPTMWTIICSHNSNYITLLFICQVNLVEDLGIEPSRQVPCKGSPLTPEHPP